MTGILTALSTATNIISAVNNTSFGSKKEVADAILKTIDSKSNTLINTNGSITKLLSYFIVEPIIIASNNAKSTEVIEKLAEINTDMFASFYTQAFEILRSIYGQDVETIVNVLSTDSGGIGRIIMNVAKKTVSTEDNTDYLADLFDTNTITLAIESVDSHQPFFKVNAKDSKDQPLSGILQRNIEITVTSDTIVEGVKKPHTIIIPITIKTTVLFVGTDSILNMLAPNSTTKTFSYRLDEYRSGAISLADLIFAGDIIKEYKENKLKDKEQLLSIISSRTISANSKLATKDMVGFEKSYNMLIITTDDKVHIDKQMNGDIEEEKYKQKLLEQANGMTCSIISPDYERVTILTRDIRGKIDLSFKTINKRKDSGLDITEIMKAMMNGRPPVF